MGLGRKWVSPMLSMRPCSPLPGPGAGHQDGQAPPLAVLIHLEGKIQAILLPHAPVEDGKPDVVALLSGTGGAGLMGPRSPRTAGPGMSMVRLQRRIVVIIRMGLVIR